MTSVASTRNVRVTGRRIGATVIDGLVLGAVSGLLTRLFGTETDSSGFALTTLSPGGSLLLLVIVLLYYTLLEGFLGRTVGKMVTGIRVIDEATGDRPGLVSALVRTLLRIVDGLFAYLVGLIIVVNSDRRRRLGDMAAKTLVVKA
ncbi:RDD family protein [Micromonospora sp. NPDC049559]|uniref:RDD family protein n=1 Tax=Micromonospora sp. NPDC049559 TaxID=3155923 RepID=UPI0034146475